MRGRNLIVGRDLICSLSLKRFSYQPSSWIGDGCVFRRFGGVTKRAEGESLGPASNAAQRGCRAANIFFSKVVKLINNKR